MPRLIGNLYTVAGTGLTHPWDATAYLVAGDEPVLIDCGSTLGYASLKRNLQALGYEPKDIRKVIATHGHWDHVSAMALLRQESDAEFWIHEWDREQVETGDGERTASFLYNHPFPSIQVDGVLRDGDRFQCGGFEFLVIHTPGHSPGSISLYAVTDELKFLIVGDTLYGGYHERIRSNLAYWKDSLQKLSTLDVDALSWGHGQPVFLFDANTRVREAIQQLGVYFNPWFKPFHLQFQH
ncbi:MAG: MBL fold metallo-hydrolase [Alicyclobacillus sp.]|nr:MBL fold metallo-hydrolase [Alicyclobacillus sp.]